MVIVDAMNVRGCVPDGWWRDKPGALRRVVEAIAAHDWTDDEGTRGRVELRYAGHSARDAADDEIVALARSLDLGDGPVVVVTSDRGLIERLPAGVAVEGARAFRRRLGF